MTRIPYIKDFAIYSSYSFLEITTFIPDFQLISQTDRFQVECYSKSFNDNNITQSVIPAKAGIHLNRYVPGSLLSQG